MAGNFLHHLIWFLNKSLEMFPSVLEPKMWLDPPAEILFLLRWPVRSLQNLKCNFKPGILDSNLLMELCVKMKICSNPTCFTSGAFSQNAESRKFSRQERKEDYFCFYFWGFLFIETDHLLWFYSHCLKPHLCSSVCQYAVFIAHKIHQFVDFLCNITPDFSQKIWTFVDLFMLHI